MFQADEDIHEYFCSLYAIIDRMCLGFPKYCIVRHTLTFPIIKFGIIYATVKTYFTISHVDSVGSVVRQLVDSSLISEGTTR